MTERLLENWSCAPHLQTESEPGLVYAELGLGGLAGGWISLSHRGCLPIAVPSEVPARHLTWSPAGNMALGASRSNMNSPYTTYGVNERGLTLY